MSSLVEATSAIHWQHSNNSSTEPFELGLLELVQAAAGAAGSASCALVRHALHRPPAGASTQMVVPPAPIAEQTEEPEEDVEVEASPLDGAPGIDVLHAHGFKQAFGRAAMAEPGGVFPQDHVFRAFVKSGLIKDERVFFKGSRPHPPPPSSHVEGGAEAAAPPQVVAVVGLPQAVLVGAYALGPDACGHAGITHGGITAALMDESFGELLYIAKMKGIMKFKYVVTASLEVGYKKPWSPTQAPVYVTVHVSQVDGRKIWLEASLADAPLKVVHPAQGTAGEPTGAAVVEVPEGCSVYATAKALFLEPRPQGSSSAVLDKAAEGRTDKLGERPL